MRPGFQHPRLNDPEWLAAAYERSTINAIAESLGVSGTSVLRALRAHGIERRSRNHRLTPIQHPLLADREWLVAEYSTATATGIAASIGVHRATVARALRLPRAWCSGRLGWQRPRHRYATASRRWGYSRTMQSERRRSAASESTTAGWVLPISISGSPPSTRRPSNDISLANRSVRVANRVAGCPAVNR